MNLQVPLDNRPWGYGYGRCTDAVDLDKQKRSAGAKCAAQNWLMVSFYAEDFTTEPFLSREMGKRLLFEIMRPGDWLLAHKFTRIFNDARDALATVQFMRTKELNLFIADSSHIHPSVDDKKLWDWIRRRVQNSGAELSKLRGGGRLPVGWKQYGHKIVPFKEERIAALRVVELRDKEQLSWEEVLQRNARFNYWPSQPFSRERAKEAYVAAKSRFPGLEGEIEECMEGTGI